MFNIELSIILDFIIANSTKLPFILGDFNIDLVMSDFHTPASDFLNIFTTHSFIPTILYPTRITDTSSTLIDNTFINNITNHFDTAIIYNDISDHFPIAMHFDTLFLKPKLDIEYSKPLYNPQTIESFKIALSEVDWSAIYRLSTECVNPSECYSLFINKYLELFHDHFPTRSRRFSIKKHSTS